VTKLLIKLCLVICVSLGSQAVLAGPVLCSVNNQDSTCLTPITTVWQTAPTCPESAGWTTITPAQWIGSQFSAPQCNFQKRPTCPNGFTETSPPIWDGSSWSALGCAVPPPALPTMPQIAAACTAAVAPVHPGANFGSYDGPYAVNGGNLFPPPFQNGGFVLNGGGGAAGDFYWAQDLSNPPRGGSTGSNGRAMCWFQSGTANLIDYGYAYDQGYDGG
jgi:hypothetical protein